MGRNILLITTDQQRFDSLRCNGSTVANTPVVDRLAQEGINYQRAYNQNTVCMPARSSILTGQYVRTHGVIANGIPLPESAPSVAAYLNDKAGYRTALIGKAHFEPGFDFNLKWNENKRAVKGDIGYWRGFERSIQAMHAAAFGKIPLAHYGRWLKDNHPEHMQSYADLLGAVPGGDTLAPETKNNPIPTEWYHTNWIANLVIQQLDEYKENENWFIWMSFPDPHHPWDPPASELYRIPWQELSLPDGYPKSREDAIKILSKKPAHWLAYYEGKWSNAEGAPMNFNPSMLTEDMVREINAKVHVMNELIDESCGKVIDHLSQKGWLDDTDIFFTTDHGEMQGDFGLIYKGPFHTDSLMRLPFIWRPSKNVNVKRGVKVTNPIQQIDLTATICDIAGLAVPSWCQGKVLPQSDSQTGFDRAVCEWDSQFPGYGMHLRTIYRDGWVATFYEKSTGGIPNGLEEVMGNQVLAKNPIQYDGNEGELYNLNDDPHQFVNLFGETSHKALVSDLKSDLYDALSQLPVTNLKVEAPA
jgi:arylsulfatase A-like enzyme